MILNNLSDNFQVKNTKRPVAIIAKTVKGKGFSFTENNNDWHHAPLSKQAYEQAKKELNI